MKKLFTLLSILLITLVSFGQKQLTESSNPNNATQKQISEEAEKQIIYYTTATAKLDKIKLPSHLKVGATANMTGSIQNTGALPIFSFDIAFSIDGTSQNVHTFSGVNIPSGAFYNFTIQTPILATIGTYNIDVQIQKINAEAVNKQADNSLSTEVKVLAWLPVKKVFGEEGTGTWCGACPIGICVMDDMEEAYPDTWIGTAIHINDPMEQVEWTQAVGIMNYPSGKVDRGNEIIYPFQFEEEYLNRINTFGYASIDLENFVWNPTTRLVSLDVKATFADDISDELSLALAITEDNVHGTGSDYDQKNYYSGGGFGEACGFEDLPEVIPAEDMYYRHVARIMLDGPNGTPGSITPPVTNGSIFTQHYEYTIPEDWVAENLHFVGLLFNITTNRFLNANDELVTNIGISEFENNENISIYPNPSTSLVNIKSENNIESVSIYNLVGQFIYSKSVNSNTYSLDVSTFSPGVYLFQIDTKEARLSKRVVVE